MALNKYQWELYLKSDGKKTVQFFKNFLDGKFDGYAEFIKSLVSNYCPDPDMINNWYETSKWATEMIQNLLEEDSAESKSNELTSENSDSFEEPANACEWLKLDWENYLSENNAIGNWKTFGTYIYGMLDYTQVLAFLNPRIFFPYYFHQNFNILYAIADLFDISLPTIPGKTQYYDRIMYYGKLCNVFIDFANENDMSPEELWAFIYDYAPSCVGGKEWVLDEIPEPRNVFVFGFGPQYPEKEKNRKWICQGSPDMQIGDIGLLYHWAPDKCYTSIWRAISPGFFDPLGIHDRYVCYGNPIEIPHITYSELRNDRIFKETSLVKQSMLHMDGAQMLPSEYMHLLEMARAKGEVPKDVPVFELKDDLAKGELTTERDVEEQLLEPLLLRLGWKAEDWCRQMPIRIGRGIRKYPDYVIKPIYTKNNERGEIVLEAKLSIPNKKQLEVDRGQAHSYAKLLNARAYVLVAKEGIWISEKEDEFDKILEYTWKELENKDVFSKVNWIIGNQVKNTQKKRTKG